MYDSMWLYRLSTVSKTYLNSEEGGETELNQRSVHVAGAEADSEDVLNEGGDCALSQRATRYVCVIMGRTLERNARGLVVALVAC